MQHYLQIACRKLLLFHGRRNLAPRGAAKQQPGGSELVVRLSDLVNSPVMAELQELLLLGSGAEAERDLYCNWFSLQVCAFVCVWVGGCWCRAHQGGSAFQGMPTCSCCRLACRAIAEHAARAGHVHRVGPGRQRQPQ
jgi:hypothetical protein